MRCAGSRPWRGSDYVAPAVDLVEPFAFAHYSPIMTTDRTQHFSEGLRELAGLATRGADALGPEMDRALEIVRETVANGGTLFFCGNGGSAADAQHMATEYVV